MHPTFLCYSVVSFVLNYLSPDLTAECLTGMDIRVPQAKETRQHRKVLIHVCHFS